MEESSKGSTSIVAGVPIMLIAALLLWERLLPETPAGLVACLGLGLVHVGGQGAIAWALGRLPAATASVAVFVQPVVAALVGWALLGEAVTPVAPASRSTPTPLSPRTR